GAVLVLAPGDPAPSVVQPGAAPPPSSDGCGLDPRPTGAPLREKAPAVADRLTAALTDAVRQRVAPGTTLGVHPTGQYPKGTQHGPLAFFHVFSALVAQEGGVCSGGEDYFMAAASTSEKARKGNVWAIVTRLGGNAAPAAECQQAPRDTQSTCHRRTGPHGETIVEETLTLPRGATVNRVDVTKPDGTGLTVEAENTARDAKLDDAPDMPSPPLSLTQLAEVALDPGLTLYP
ncbi:hypothetical protein, partial [Amycolatopsis vancoresmycina]